MNKKLKPCPFCGGEAERQWGINPKPIYWVECTECGIEGVVCLSEEEAIEAWNRRATDE